MCVTLAHFTSASVPHVTLAWVSRPPHPGERLPIRQEPDAWLKSFGGGHGSVWLPHQHVHHPLLHAGPEHHARPRLRRSIRCLWHAGHQSDAVLQARADPAPGVEIWRAYLQLLGDQCRSGIDAPAQPAAGGAASDLGERGTRHLVRPLRRVPADAHNDYAPLASGGGRFHLHVRRGGLGMARARPKNWVVAAQHVR